MIEKKVIKHYGVALYEVEMNTLKSLLGNKVTSHDALAAAVEFSICNMISDRELISMAKKEKKLGGNKRNGK